MAKARTYSARHDRTLHPCCKVGAAQSNKRAPGGIICCIDCSSRMGRLEKRTIRHPVTTGIAVLPFENLSDAERERIRFADGVQDDILTKLAKIDDLKVISRTSVMEYRGKRNIRQIGDALRVSHVLEGSARRSGDRIHLNAQLIDTRTDTHVWAEEYDRDLNDLFAVQTEIAQKVAQQLHAKLSASEQASVEERPTQDLVAYDFYIRAVSLITIARCHPRRGV